MTRSTPKGRGGPNGSRPSRPPTEPAPGSRGRRTRAVGERTDRPRRVRDTGTAVATIATALLALAFVTAFALALSARAHARTALGAPAFARIEIGAAGDESRRRCVAIRVAERRLLTAAHCLDGASAPPERLTLHCPEGNGTASLRIARALVHPSHDAALILLDAAPTCLGAPTPIARTIDIGTRLFGRRLAPRQASADDSTRTARRPPARAAGSDGRPDGGTERASPLVFPLVELERDAHVLLLDDPLACLERGDSGHPVFAEDGRGAPMLVAMLIGGTPTCPSLQSALRLDRLAGWVRGDANSIRPTAVTRFAFSGVEAREPYSRDGRHHDATGRDTPSRDRCAVETCPEIDIAAASYCSLDPEQLPAGGAFTTKARLELSGGRLAADAHGRTAAPALALVTPRGRTPLRALGPATIVRRAAPDANDSETAPLALEARYASATGDAFELVLLADRDGAPGDAHGLGDRRDAEAFLAAGRRLLLRARSPVAAFPDVDRASIAFAPCELPSRADERFVFMLEDGARVALTVRAANGAHALGFYVGRVLDARIESASGPRHVVEDFDLAFVGGSRQLAELALPTLAVRTPRGPAGCGYLFDASLWDTAAARDGYVARRLGCDGTPTERVPLRSARYPERYVLP